MLKILYLLIIVIFTLDTSLFDATKTEFRQAGNRIILYLKQNRLINRKVKKTAKIQQKKQGKRFFLAFLMVHLHGFEPGTH